MQLEVSRQAPIFIVMNAAAGDGDSQALRASVEDYLARAGRRTFFRMVERPAELESTVLQAARQAREHEGVLVASGGDGTLRTVAQAALDHDVPLGLIPRGTFNYFSRTYHIPADPIAAAQLLLQTHALPVRVGLVNDRVFLVNASLGLYPDLLEDRETYKRRLGRHRSVALWAALNTLLRRHQHLRLTLREGAQQRTVTTSTLFVGNNQLQLEQLGLSLSRELTDGELAAIMVRPASAGQLLSLALRAAAGRLEQSDQAVSFPLGDLTVRPLMRLPGGRIKVSTDGEVDWLAPPLRFRVAPRPLYVLRPEPLSVQDGQAA